MRGSTLTTFDMEILLRWFEHRINADDRCALMAEFPAIYNRWVGKRIAEVVKARDHEGNPLPAPEVLR